jgi:hypothetical protein
VHPQRPSKLRASEPTRICISASRANRQHIIHHRGREFKEEAVDAEEHPIAGLDYEVAVLRRVQRGRVIVHVASTGNGEITFAR